jgi:hypothetical protein
MVTVNTPITLSYANAADIQLITARDSSVIFLCLNYYKAKLKWPRNNYELMQYYDRPKGNFNNGLLNDITLMINDKKNLEINIKSGSTYRKIELRKTENGKIKYKAKYFESNDHNLKNYLPFELDFTDIKRCEFYGTIK